MSKSVLPRGRFLLTNHPLAAMLVLCVGLSSPVMSADEQPPEADAVSTRSVDEPIVGDESDIGSLARQRFALRRESTLELWRDRDRWRDAVVAGSRSEDPEISQRCRWVLQRWRRGILHDTPLALADRLSLREPVEAVELLLGLGRFEAACAAVEEAAGTIDQDAMLGRLGVTIDSQFPLYVHLALQHDKFDAFLKFLDLCCDMPELAISRFDLLRTMGRELDEEGLLPPRAKTWDTAKQIEVLCLLHLLNDDPAMALATAARSKVTPDQRSLLRVVRMLTGRWQSIADDALASADSLFEEARRVGDDPAVVSKWSLPLVRHWSDALLAANRLDDVVLQSKIVAAIVGLEPSRAAAEPNPQPSPDDRAPSEGDSDAEIETPDEASVTVQTLRWRTLMIHAEVDQAMRILRQFNVDEAAAVAFTLGRGDSGFRDLGFPLDQVDEQLETWLDEAIAAQVELSARPSRQSQLAPSVNSLLRLMRGLIKVGRHDAAYRIAERLSRPEVTAGPILVREYVVSRLTSEMTESDWAFRLAMVPPQTEPTQITLQILASSLAVADHRLIPAISELVSLEEPSSSALERYRIACRVARAEVEHQFENAVWLAKLAQRLDDGSLARSLEQRGGDSRAMPSPETWVAFLQASGRSDLAQRWEDRLAANADGVSASGAARDWLAGLHGPIEDSKLQEALADDSRRGLSLLVDRYRDAIVRGDDQSASRWLDELMLCACTPSTDTRKFLADELVASGNLKLADELYRGLLTITALSSDETLALVDIAREYYSFVTDHRSPPEKEPFVWNDPLLTADDHFPSESGRATSTAADKERLAQRTWALDWFALAFAGTLESSDYRETTYVTLPLYLVHERLAIAAEASRDPSTASKPAMREAIQRDLARALRWNPVDITVAESTLPRLRQRGHRSIADDAFDSIFAAGQSYLRTYANDSMTANNVAWSAAMNQRHLADALRLSRLAVHWEPDSAIYRDTLAELLARNGQVEEALQIEQACLIDDPGQWHLHQQVQRLKIALTPSLNSELKPDE